MSTMTGVLVKRKEGTKAAVLAEPYEAGSILITNDTNEVYIDSSLIPNKRIKLGNPINLYSGDLNTMIDTGKWIIRTPGSITNLPATQMGVLEVVNCDIYATQKYHAYTNDVYVRIGEIQDSETITWGTWRQI